MKKVCIILLMLALFGCVEGGGGAGVPVKPPVDGGGGTIPPVDPPAVPPVDVPTLPTSDIQTDNDAQAAGDASFGSGENDRNYGASAEVTGEGNATASGSLAVAGATVDEKDLTGANAVTDKGNANADGSVTISDSTVNVPVYGSFAEVKEEGNATATGSITVTDSTIADRIYGALAIAKEVGNAIADGIVTLTNTDVTGDETAADVNFPDPKAGVTVYGGYSEVSIEGDAKATGSVTVTGGTINANIGGVTAITENGLARAGAAKYSSYVAQPDGAKVTLNGTTVNGSVWGAYAEALNGSMDDPREGYYDEDGKPGESYIDDEGNAVGEHMPGSAYASFNIVDITGSPVSDSVYGGIAKANGGWELQANSNKVTVSNSNVGGDVIGGTAIVNGENVYSNARENTVTIDNTVVGKDVYGGYVDILDGSSKLNVVFADGNSVYIKGDNTEIHGTIAGSLIRFEGSAVFDSGDTLQASYNNVWLQDALKLSGASIYGGIIDIKDINSVTVQGYNWEWPGEEGVGDLVPVPVEYGFTLNGFSTFSQNSLFVNDYKGQEKLANIGNFEYFAFNLNPLNHLSMETAVLKTENLYLGSAPIDMGEEYGTAIFPSSVGVEYYAGYNQDYTSTFGAGIQFSGSVNPEILFGSLADKTIYLIAADNAWNYDGSKAAEEGVDFASSTVKVQVGSLFEITRDFTTHLEDNNIVAKMVTETWLGDLNLPVSNSVGIEQVMTSEAIQPPTRVVDDPYYSAQKSVSSLFYAPDNGIGELNSTVGIDSVTSSNLNLSDYENKVQYAASDGSMIARHSKGHHTGDGARILTPEQTERREARKAAWQSLTDEQKAERRTARQARPDGAIIEHGHRHHDGSGQRQSLERNR